MSGNTIAGYRVTFDSPQCPDTGCDVSGCVYMTVFQGTTTHSGNPHNNVALLYVAATVGDAASVDVIEDTSSVLTSVFSLEAVCP
jgi:hypothetical protein